MNNFRETWLFPCVLWDRRQVVCQPLHWFTSLHQAGTYKFMALWKCVQQSSTPFPCSHLDTIWLQPVAPVFCKDKKIATYNSWNIHAADKGSIDPCTALMNENVSKPISALWATDKSKMSYESWKRKPKDEYHVSQPASKLSNQKKNKCLFLIKYCAAAKIINKIK